MRRAEGTFNRDRLGDEAPYDDRERIRGEGQIVISPDRGHSDTLDYEL